MCVGDPLLSGDTNGRDGVRGLCLILTGVRSVPSALVYDGQQTQRPTSSPQVSANGAAHLVMIGFPWQPCDRDEDSFL